MSKMSKVFFWFCLIFMFLNFFKALKTPEYLWLEYIGVVIGGLGAVLIYLNEKLR